MMYREWIKRGLKKPGKSAIGLAKALKAEMKNDKVYNRSAVYKITTGVRNIQVDELPVIAAYIEESIPMLDKPMVGTGDLLTLPIERQVGVGAWHERGQPYEVVGRSITTPRDQEFPNAEHSAFLVKGDSNDAIGVMDGDVVVCIEYNGDIADGMLVVVQRDHAGLVELSVKTVRLAKDHVEFVSLSHNKTYKPIIATRKGKVFHCDHEKITVVAIVRRVTRNVG